MFFTVVHRGTDFWLTAASCLYRCSDTFISARIRRDWPPAFYGKPNTSFLGCYTKREKAGASITLKPMKRWPSQPPRRKKRLGHNVRESIKVMTPPLGRIGSELRVCVPVFKKKILRRFLSCDSKKAGAYDLRGLSGGGGWYPIKQTFPYFCYLSHSTLHFPHFIFPLPSLNRGHMNVPRRGPGRRYTPMILGAF